MTFNTNVSEDRGLFSEANVVSGGSVFIAQAQPRYFGYTTRYLSCSMPSRLRKFWRGDSEQSSQTLRPSPEKREKSFPVGIKELHKPKSAVVDLVFIHGLTGHRENTWTAKGSTSGPWPAVLLSEKIPNARILTFGYDALVVDWRGVVSNNRLGNHARNLAATLATHRENDETSDRPIIFIAHSLGGLVCEDVGALPRA